MPAGASPSFVRTLTHRSSWILDRLPVHSCFSCHFTALCTCSALLCTIASVSLAEIHSWKFKCSGWLGTFCSKIFLLNVGGKELPVCMRAFHDWPYQTNMRMTASPCPPEHVSTSCNAVDIICTLLQSYLDQRVERARIWKAETCHVEVCRRTWWPAQGQAQGTWRRGPRAHTVGQIHLQLPWPGRTFAASPSLRMMVGPRLTPAGAPMLQKLKR